MLRFPSLMAGLILIQAAGGSAQPGEKPKPDPKKIPPAAAFLLKVSPEEFIKRFDKNKDGYLSRDEVPPFLVKNFDKVDKNGDGKLDRQEIAQLKAVLQQRFGKDRKDTAEIEKIVTAL